MVATVTKKTRSFVPAVSGMRMRAMIAVFSAFVGCTKAVTLPADSSPVSKTPVVKRTGYKKPTVENTTWVLEELFGEKVDILLYPRHLTFLFLDANKGEIKGSSGCSWFRGEYTLEGDKLRIPFPGQRNGGCFALTDWRFRNALEETRTFEVVGDALKLYDEKRRLVATFTPCP